MGPPLPLLLLAAAGVKQLLKRRPHRRRGQGAVESQCCGGTSAPAIRTMSCKPCADPAVVSWSPMVDLLGQLSLLLHTSLAAMGCRWPVMQAVTQCAWTLRWLLAVQANAAEAFASDFDLVSPKAQGRALQTLQGTGLTLCACACQAGHLVYAIIPDSR